MESVVEILMRRDDMSRGEAERLVEETRYACLAALYRGGDPEDIFMEMVGLDPEYLLELL